MNGDRRMSTKIEFHSQTIKAAPAIVGTLSSVQAEAMHLDWAQMAAAATFFYVVLQGFYLLWKWNRERKLPPIIGDKNGNQSS